MEALLSVKNLSIGIRRDSGLLSSVEDVSLDIYPGDIVGIVGESGSGKSLTALSIPGLLGDNKKVTCGSIVFDNRDLFALNERELEDIRGKEISMIFQEPFSSLNPLVKAGAQIAEALTLHDKSARPLANNTVRDIMRRLELLEPEKLMNAYPHQLSGGMCQRIMIAAALICRPRLLIADEPTTALDQDTQGQILALMKEINRNFGTTILFISHDLSLIKDFCGRVLIMYSGRILEEGSAEEIFTHPAHEYTRGLLGCIPGRAKKGTDLAAIPGKIPSLEEGRPKGCPFHPRCGKASAACKGEFPPARTLSATHKTHCVLEAGE